MPGLEPVEVTYELVVAYQEALHAYRKANGTPLSVPPRSSASCRSRSSSPGCAASTGSSRTRGRSPDAPADRQLPEATLSGGEMAASWASPM